MCGFFIEISSSISELDQIEWHTGSVSFQMKKNHPNMGDPILLNGVNSSKLHKKTHNKLKSVRSPKDFRLINLVAKLVAQV